MGFSYTAGSTATLDRVRFEIGDTESNRLLFQDEELNDIIAQETDVLPSAARACEILATRFARDFDFTADGSSFKKGQVTKMYTEMARRLRVRATGSTTVQSRPKDGYSDDINADTATQGNSRSLDFDRGRWQEF